MTTPTLSSHRFSTPPRRGRTPSKPGAVPGQVQSLTRGLQILETLAKAEGGLTLTEVAHRVTLHASGVGKAIFASLPDEQIDAILKVKGLPRITENTITAPETMWASVRVIRQRGWSFDDEEHAISTRCVASPIYDEHADVLGAISLAGPSSRLPDPRIKQLGPLVAHTAEELTKRLGGRWPHPF